MYLAPGRTTKGVKKLRAAEANAGKQIVMEQAKQSQEELDTVDKSSYPLDTVPAVVITGESSELRLINRSRSQKPHRLSRETSTCHAQTDIVSRLVYLVQPCRNEVMGSWIGINPLAVNPAGRGHSGEFR
jgi:hypothetical protein